MRQTFVHPVPQFSPQTLDLYRHTQPNILFYAEGGGFESTFGKRKGKLGSQAQKYRTDLIKKSQEMNDIVMEDEDTSLEGARGQALFDKNIQERAFKLEDDSNSTAPYSGREDESMTEERSGGNLLSAPVEELDIGMGGIGMGDEMALEGESQSSQMVLRAEQGLVVRDPPVHALPYLGNAVGRRGSTQSIVSSQSVVSSTTRSNYSSNPTVTEYDSDDEAQFERYLRQDRSGLTVEEYPSQRKLSTPPVRKQLRAVSQADRPVRPPSYSKFSSKDKSKMKISDTTAQDIADKLSKKIDKKVRGKLYRQLNIDKIAPKDNKKKLEQLKKSMQQAASQTKRNRSGTSSVSNQTYNQEKFIKIK